MLYSISAMKRISQVFINLYLRFFFFVGGGLFPSYIFNFATQSTTKCSNIL